MRIKQLTACHKIVRRLACCGIDFEFKWYKTFVMKKVILFMLIAAGSLIAKPVTGQVSVNINIGAQPVWGPVGYDYVDYYYLPGIESYYYVPTRQFIYFSNGRWIFARTLPARYSYFNIYSGYKVVINEPRPYLQFNLHKIKYAKYKGYNGRQVIIKNSNNPKYYVVKGHPKYKATGNRTVTAKSKGGPDFKNKGRGGPGNSVAKGKGNGNGKGRN